MASHGFIRLPPDGAGKQVPQSVMVEVLYDTGTTAFAVGDIVTFSITTAITGTVLSVDEATGTTGEIHVRVDEPVPATIGFTTGENIIVNATTYAKVVSAEAPLYFQNTVLVGQNMTNTARITQHGELVTTFNEGSPEFDAFGKIRTSAETTLAEYVMSYDELPEQYSTVITGGATMVYDHDIRGVLITCGTASGDKVMRTTNRYHIHQTGYSQLIQFTGSMGDPGKTNVIRRGGYYDDDNGVYFEFKENTFGVGIRSTATGSLVETFIPQTDWNVDQLDGSGGISNPSKQAANPLQDNIFWIDLQCSAGVVRWGVVINGIRIVAHQRQNTDNTSIPFIAGSSLPFRYEQENIGVSASSSEFRMFNAIIKTEGPIHSSRKSFTTDSTGSITTVNETPILSFKNAQTYKTFDNRVTAYPTSFDVYNSAAEAIMFTIRFGSTATAGSWAAPDADSSVEENKTATASTGGRTALSHLVAPNSRITVTFPTEVSKRLEMRRLADITEWVEFQLGAKLLIAGTGGSVTVVANWDESAG